MIHEIIVINFNRIILGVFPDDKHVNILSTPVTQNLPQCIDYSPSRS